MKKRKHRKNLIYLLAVIILGISIASTILVVYADIDGNGLRITAQQPDKLVLQLGADWAGTEFELKLDSSIFFAPLITNSFGTLTMELGGSKTYTLTRSMPMIASLLKQQRARSIGIIACCIGKHHDVNSNRYSSCIR